MKVEQATIEDILSMYKPECTYLSEAEFNYPAITGKFRIPFTYYTHESLKHLTEIEAVLCLNQLAYVFFAEIIRNQSCPEVRELTVELYKTLQKENTWITMSKKKFKKPMLREHNLHGKMDLANIRKRGNCYFSELTWDMENGSAYGELVLVLT